LVTSTNSFVPAVPAVPSYKPKPESALWTEVRGSGTRIVFLHGFTQAGRSWNPVLRAFDTHNATESDANHVEVLLPDLPGHGRSADTALDLNTTADLLASALGPAIYVGYSMGGRVALHVALHYPEAVRGVLLFGATPGLETETERQERREADELLAQHLEATDVPTFLQRWLSSPLFATLPTDPEDLALRGRNTAAGLASSLRLSGTGSQSSLWDSLNTIRVPMIVAAGDRDTKFTAIAQAMTKRIGPNASFEPVTNAGHACHLEQPGQAATLLATLLAKTQP
jgi:2-succinyl-6-hydroxy-2,4-cyclohexadiene-1-carboxylate synthase